MDHSTTFIDNAGNHAQYTVSDRNHRNEFYWSTDHGDHGLANSFEQARDSARAFLKASMAVRRRENERNR